MPAPITQLELARVSETTPEMEFVARREGLSAELIRDEVAAGRMVIELGRVESSADLETELQRTLRDRDLALLRWSKPEGTYVGCDGAPVALPHGDSGREVSFLQGAGRPLMAVVHHPDALGTPEITEAVMAEIKEATDKLAA